MTTLTLDEITRLTPPERLALIGDLWDSMADADLALPTAQYHEPEDRLSSFDNDRQAGVSWAELKAELAARIV